MKGPERPPMLFDASRYELGVTGLPFEIIENAVNGLPVRLIRSRRRAGVVYVAATHDCRSRAGSLAADQALNAAAQNLLPEVLARGGRDRR